MEDKKVPSPKSQVQSSKREEQKTKDEGQRTKDKNKSAIRNPQSAMVLVGFMASGKTTVARALAERFECDFVDLDSFIESREGRSIASIIDGEGEGRFRELETIGLREVFEKGNAQVIALGGGAWTIEENRKLISENDCQTVWLDVPFEVCWARIKTENDTRPFARDKEKAKKLYHLRKNIYSLSKCHVDLSQEMDVKAIVNEIIRVMTNDK